MVAKINKGIGTYDMYSCIYILYNHICFYILIFGGLVKIILRRFSLNKILIICSHIK